MFGLLKLAFFVLWLIGLVQGRSLIVRDWHEVSERKLTTFVYTYLTKFFIPLTDTRAGSYNI